MISEKFVFEDFEDSNAKRQIEGEDHACLGSQRADGCEVVCASSGEPA